MWNDYELPKKAVINDVEIDMRTDYRVILDLFIAFNDEELSDEEKILIALQIFYVNFEDITDYEQAIKTMYLFINGNKEEQSIKDEKPLIDWNKDISLIIPPINRIIGQEIRATEYMHWWTFLGAFMEIGECTFSTYVGIRIKRNKGKKLEKHEQDIYKENKSKIDIKSQRELKLEKEFEEQIEAMLRGES